MKFKVGDRVKIRKWDDMVKEFGVGCNGHISSISPIFNKNMKELCGRVGTLTGVSNHIVFIKFDDRRGNTCWSYSVDMIEPLKPETIVIYYNRKDNTVVAKNTLTDEKAIAKCHPDDKFDFKIGAAVAFDRLVGRKEPKKEEYYNGKVVCVKDYVDVTVGKIYEVVDGKFKDDVGDMRPDGYEPVKSFQQLNTIIPHTFIEVVE